MWDRAIVAVLLTAVVGSAVTSGAVEPWSLAILELMVILVILMWAGRSYSARRVSIAIPRATAPIGMLVLIGLAQSVALAGKDGRTSSLSLDVEATRSAALVLFLLTGCFLAGVNFFVGRRRVWIITRCLVVYGLVMAVFALVQHLASDGHTYWLRPLSQGPSWFGPFVNHSHFAGYMTLLIPIPVAVMMNRSVRSEERLLFGFAASVMGLAVVVSLSRGGMIGLASELLFLLIAGSRAICRLIARVDDHLSDHTTGPGWLGIAAIGLLIGSVTAGVLLLGPEPVANRIVRGNAAENNQSESFYESRGWIWRDSIRVFEEHPLLGVGMGAFETAFPMYSHSDGSLLVSQAHNDYLQVLTDCGIAGGIMAIWFVGAIGSAVYRGLRSRDPFTRALALGSGAAVFGMLVHSIFDFNLQLPSTALLFLLICAIASVAGGRTHRDRKRTPVEADIVA
jgi:O-antigen ligase